MASKTWCGSVGSDAGRRGARKWAILAIGTFALLLFRPASAADEGLRELRLPSILVESAPDPLAEDGLPAATYPLQKVDQLPFHGAWHGFVNTTTGGLVFGVEDFRVPGRMPIDVTHVFDSKISSSLPPPPPGQVNEARQDQDMGKGWILPYSSYLIAFTGGFTMATPDGNVIRWADQGNGLYLPFSPVPSKHLRLEVVDSTTLAETQTDGTRWIYTEGVINGANHGLTRIEDRSGNSIDLTYTQGFLTEIENSDGSTVTIERPFFTGDPVNFSTFRVTKISDGAGREVAFDYNSSGLLTTATDVEGHDWTYTYASNSKLASATDPLNNVYLTASYNAQHRIATYEAQDGLWTFTYSTSRTLVEDIDENVWIYNRNTVGITTKIEEPTGGEHEITLDSNRNPIGYVDPEGVTTSWTYDANHLPTSYTPPGVGTNSITFSYNSTEHWVDSVAALGGGVTTFTRDTDGRVTEELHPDGGKWTATYSTEGDRLTLKLPRGNVVGATGFEWTFTYDDFGQLQTATDPTGREFQFEYDDYGNMTKYRRPHEHVQGQLVYAEWTYAYDLAGRLTDLTDPLGHTWTTEYDIAGRLVERHGPAGTFLRYTYDGHHRLTSAAVVDGTNDPTTTFEYDALGRLVEKTLPMGGTWTYTYDDSSRLASTTDPLERVHGYTRDLAGRIVGLSFPGGQEVTLTRDSAGRLIEREIPGGRVESFSYNSTTGKLVHAETSLDNGNWVGSIDWVHDSMGRPTSISTTIDDGTTSTSQELSYTYDVDGNRATLEAEGGETVTYEYDELDRLIETVSDLNDDWTLTYDADSGYRIGLESTSEERSWSYDPVGRMTEALWNGPGDDESHVLYEWDEEGRLVATQDLVGNTTTATEISLLGLVTETIVVHDVVEAALTYTYDAAGQLVGRTEDVEGHSSKEFAFGYDTAGRLIYARQDQEIRTYDWNDNPQDPAATLSLTRRSTSENERTAEMLYDFDGRLQTVWEASSEDSDPILVRNTRWSALTTDLALEMSERSSEGEYESRRVIVGTGGYYAADLDPGDSTLLHPAVEARRTAFALETMSVGNVPDPVAPFALGRWAYRDDLLTLAGSVTALSNSRRLARTALSAPGEDGDGLAEMQGFRSPEADVVDDWWQRPLHGHRRRPQSDVVPPAPQGANGDEPWGAGWSLPALPQCDPYTLYPGNSPLDWIDIGCVPMGDWDVWTPIAPSPPRCEFDLLDGVPPLPVYRDQSEGGVELSQGQLVQTVTDLSVFHPAGNIELTRTYRGNTGYNGPLGHGWFLNWGDRIVVEHPSAPDPELDCTVVRWLEPGGTYTDFYVGEPPPPNSPYVLIVDEASTYARYKIRHVSGWIREFDVGGQLQLLTDGRQSLEFVYDASNRLERIDRIEDGVLIHGLLAFAYYGYDQSNPALHPGLIKEVRSLTDPTDPVTGTPGTEQIWVEYTYNSCGELRTVRRPPVYLAMGATTSYQPGEDYTYWSPPGGADDCKAAAKGTHLLNSVAVTQFVPGESSVAFPQTTLTATYANFRVALQCLDPSACGSPADLAYEYPSVNLGLPWTSETIVKDHRLGGVVRDLHRFSNDGELVQLEEDIDGLDRTTGHTYDGGLRSGTTYHDGTVETTVYRVQPSGVRLPEVFKRSRPGSGALSQVTYRTYEPFRGQIRTETGPEAFPLGEVPSNFDPLSEVNRPHTSLYLYDFDEAHSVTVQNQITASCTTWNTCPSTDFEEEAYNGDADDNWFGNVVKIRQFPDNQEDPLDTTRGYNSKGRLAWETRADGVRREFEYYAGTTNTDWRLSHSHSSTGLGPLAQESVVPTGGPLPPLTTHYAWSTPERLLATRDQQGFTLQLTRRAGDAALRETLCRGTVTSCDTATLGDILRRTERTYDLRGRRLNEVTCKPGTPSESQCSASNILSQARTTYDDVGRPETSSVGPPSMGITSSLTYDGRGRLVRTISPEGRVSCFGYDNLNRKIWTRQQAAANCDNPASSDPETAIVYDAMDRPVVITDPDDFDLYGWYDPYGRLEFVSDGKPANALAPVFLGSSAPTLPTTSNWYQQTSYDSAGRPTRNRFFGRANADPNADPPVEPGFLRISWQEYDALGRPTKTHVGLGGTDSYFPAEFADDDDAPTSGSGFSLITTEVGYDDYGRRNETRDAAGRITDYEFDEFGRPFRVFQPLPGRLCFHENDWTSTSCETNADCDDADLDGPCVAQPRDSIETLFDAFGRPNWTESTIHDPTGQPHHRVVETQYDDWGRAWRTIGDPDIPASQVDGLNAITETVYDRLGRIIRKGPRWSESPTDWSESEDPVPQTGDRLRKLEYDAAGRLYKFSVRMGAGWADTTLEHDKDGLVTAMIDAKSQRTEWDYTPLGRVDRMVYPEQDEKRQTMKIVVYDGNGRPLQVQYREDDSDSAPRLAWILSYDDLGRLTGRQADLTNVPEPGSPGGLEFFGTTAQSFVYDDIGRLVEATDTSGSDFPGQDITTTRAYDTADRILEENLQWSLLASGVFNSTDHSVASEYDLTGFRTRLTFPDDAYNITYDPDSLGRVASINAPDDPNDGTQNLKWLVRYQYLGGQVWKRNYRNGAELLMEKVHGRGCDALGRVLSLVTVDAANPENVITDFRYGYDRIGNLSFEQRRHELMSGTHSNGTFRTRAHTTDAMARLNHWTEGALGIDPIPIDTLDPADVNTQPTDTEAWTLDLLGNWEARSRGVDSTEETDTYAPNALNQYAEMTPEGETALPFNYDWLGQMREDMRVGGRQYIWDALGRLTKVTKPIEGTCNESNTCDHDGSIECTSDSECNEQTIGQYRYDALNRRVEKYAPAEVDKTTRYVYDGWRAVEERAVESTHSGQNQTEIVRARFGFGLTLDDVLWMDRDVATDGQGDPDPFNGIPSGSIESRFFVHHDLVGSAVALTHDDPCAEEDPPCQSPVPTVFERYTYSAYGEATAWWDPAWLGTGYAPTSAHARSKFGLPYLYTGQRFDSETGLHYYKNRFFDPSIGRFLRRDPKGLGGGLNLYEYASGLPSVLSDPLGLDPSDLPRERGMVSMFLSRNDLTGRGESERACAGLGAQWKNCQEMKDHHALKASLPGKNTWTQEEMKEAESLGWGLSFVEFTQEEYQADACAQYPDQCPSEWDSDEDEFEGPIHGTETVSASGPRKYWLSVTLELSWWDVEGITTRNGLLNPPPPIAPGHVMRPLPRRGQHGVCAPGNVACESVQEATVGAALGLVGGAAAVPRVATAVINVPNAVGLTTTAGALNPAGVQAFGMDILDGMLPGAPPATPGGLVGWIVGAGIEYAYENW